MQTHRVADGTVSLSYIPRLPRVEARRKYIVHCCKMEEKEDSSSLERACSIKSSDDRQDKTTNIVKEDPPDTTTSHRQVTEDKHGGRAISRQRAKRVRKRPRSNVHSNDNLIIETSVKRLEMDGKPLLDAGGAEQWIRVIHPYPYTFSSFAKERWVGRTVLDIYVTEFASYPEVSSDAAILNLSTLHCFPFQCSNAPWYLRTTTEQLSAKVSFLSLTTKWIPLIKFEEKMF
jgi:hypothetical protein